MNFHDLHEFSESENELTVDEVNYSIGSSSETSSNSQTSSEEKDESIGTQESSTKEISEEENSKEETEEILDEESYSGESFCSDNSSESESEERELTPRSLLSTSTSYISNSKKMIENERKLSKDDNEICELTDDMKCLSMDCLRRMNSSQQRFSSRKRNMTFTNEELMKIKRDNHILLQRIMKFQKPQNKSKIQIVQSRLSSSAINRRKVQRQIEEDNMLLLRKINEAKPHVVPRAKSASCRLRYN